ncbi:hypothetical protein BC938DRAFT_483778 [Jimgerdemannia flammicorona]|uniref:F-box domain-containing protein n=1 Tax=Jimgerdemannia flammicorona TaxID=994334 RepID=A0A433QBE3_9FUNG|nr:hypothetical protein BC938DRAFT_483778 [Jimgerdemannia flammicorona]
MALELRRIRRSLTQFWTRIGNNPATPPAFGQLSEDVVLNIFILLDCPRNFSLTCRAFRALSREPRFKAHWLIYRYGHRLAIYYGIKHFPEACNDTLLNLLVRLGAIVSRYLAQSIVQSHVGPNMEQTKTTPTAFDVALARVPFSGYTFVVNYSWQRYGEIWTEGGANDFGLFIKYTGYRSEIHRDVDQLRALITTYGFAPVPFPRGPVMRTMIILAGEFPDIIRDFLIVFHIDQSVRRRVWDSIFLLLIDWVYQPSELYPIMQNRAVLVEAITLVLGPAALGPAAIEYDDKEIFKSTFLEVFTRYPDSLPIAVIVGVLATLQSVKLSFEMEQAVQEMLRGADKSKRSALVPAMKQFLQYHNGSPNKKTSLLKSITIAKKNPQL